MIELIIPAIICCLLAFFVVYFTTPPLIKILSKKNYAVKDMNKKDNEFETYSLQVLRWPVIR